jgi:hypothetical protein
MGGLGSLIPNPDRPPLLPQKEQDCATGPLEVTINPYSVLHDQLDDHICQYGFGGHT